MGDMKSQPPELVASILEEPVYSSYTSGQWDFDSKNEGLYFRTSSQLDWLCNSMFPIKIMRISSLITDWSGGDDTQSYLISKYSNLRRLYAVAWKEYYYLRPSGLISYRLGEIFNEGQEILNHPPYTPTDLSPKDIGGVGVDTDLTWTGGDPDDGDIVTYYVYFGINNPPEFVKAVTTTTYDVGTMENMRIYYWKIMSIDSYGKSSMSDIVSFITEP